MIIASSLVTPDPGLIFWTTVVFLILLVLLGKFAWKPILGAVKAREQSIDEALKLAEEARAEMANLKSDHEKLVKEAKAERDQILKEAKETRDKVVAEAQNAAKTEAAAIIAKAQEEIKRDQEQAFKQLKAEVADMAVEAATVILKGQLADKEKQQALVNEYLKEAKFN
ncbi:F0F1 ATP synthase subunit B [bacterium]|nr:F0F1 ATP synthase subunit B [bacterium]